MRTNKAAKRILLYGDSLVYGKASGQNKRLPVDVRFSGALQNLLGDNYDVIEEGLRGRMVEGENAFFPDRDGLKQFPSIVGSHLPFELAVILLGTNDCNSGSNKTPGQIAAGLIKYHDVLEKWVDFLEVSRPKVLIVAPPLINDEFYDEASKEIFGQTAPIKARALGSAFRAAAKEIAASMLDLSDVAEPARGDGIHLDESGNKAVAEAICTKVKELLG